MALVPKVAFYAHILCLYATGRSRRWWGRWWCYYKLTKPPKGQPKIKLPMDIFEEVFFAVRAISVVTKPGIFHREVDHP